MHGGLQSSTDELCKALQKVGYKVSVLAGLMGGGSFEFRARVQMKLNQTFRKAKFAKYNGLGYPVYFAWFPWNLVEYVSKQEMPDLIMVLSAANDAMRMAQAALVLQKPIIMQIHDVEFHQLGGPLDELPENITYIANSNFTAKRLFETFNLKSEIISPFIDLKLYKTETSRENITLVNPHSKKGVEIALGVARLCPEIPFVFVETWPLSDEERKELSRKLTAVTNVKLVPPTDDMKKVYGKARILLAPSIWEETFGRVAVEAQISGIPVIASNRGGLPEAVGQGGMVIDIEQPISTWAEAVRSLWHDQIRYNACSSAAVENARLFDYPNELHKWISIIHHVCNNAAQIQSPREDFGRLQQAIDLRKSCWVRQWGSRPCRNGSPLSPQDRSHRAR